MMLVRQQGTEAPARCISPTCRSILDRQPNVVGIEEGDQIASRHGNTAITCRSGSRVGLADYTDSVAILLQPRERIVLGAVIHHDYLNVWISLR